MDFSKFGEYGLVGLMAASITFLLFLVIKWTLATTREILAQAASEREAWIKALNDHTMQAKEFHSQVTEAHKFQRSEHDRITYNQEEQIKLLSILSRKCA